MSNPHFALIPLKANYTGDTIYVNRRDVSVIKSTQGGVSYPDGEYREAAIVTMNSGTALCVWGTAEEVYNAIYNG